jgi:glycosyltransferase involved in cell wall biosynthesis
MGAYVAARRLHREVAFDLVHHVTFVNFWMPTFMAFLPAPFVWGPVGGGESIPAHLWATLGWRGRIYEALRMVARWVGECLPVVRITARQAAVAIASTPETAERLRRAGADRVFQLSQVGLSDEEIARLGQIPWRRYSPFRVMSVGSLLHLKGPQLGLRAFARLRNQLADCEYWIVGEGPDRSSLEALAARLGVSAAVRFLGLRSREEVLALLGECDVLLHPALHDSGGFACAEAMAAGRPVVCLDTGGPALQVQDGTGVRVPTGHPDTLVNAFADALLSLSRDPEARRTMGERARKIIAQYARWRVKVVEMEILYSRALGEDPVVITEGGSSQWDRPPRRSRHVKPQAIS